MELMKCKFKCPQIMLYWNIAIHFHIICYCLQAPGRSLKCLLSSTFQGKPAAPALLHSRLCYGDWRYKALSTSLCNKNHKLGVLKTTEMDSP